MLHLQDDRAHAVEQDGEDEIVEEEGEFYLPVGHRKVVDTRWPEKVATFSAVSGWANVEKWNGVRYGPRDCGFGVILQGQIYGHRFLTNL